MGKEGFSLIANLGNSERQHDITGVFVPLRKVDEMSIFPSEVWGRWSEFFNQVIRETVAVVIGDSEGGVNFLDDDSNVWIQVAIKIVDVILINSIRVNGSRAPASSTLLTSSRRYH